MDIPVWIAWSKSGQKSVAASDTNSGTYSILPLAASFGHITTQRSSQTRSERYSKTLGRIEDDPDVLSVCRCVHVPCNQFGSCPSWLCLLSWAHLSSTVSVLECWFFPNFSLIRHLLVSDLWRPLSTLVELKNFWARKPPDKDKRSCYK